MPEGEVTITQASLDALHTRLDELTKRQAELDAQRAIFTRVGWLRMILSAFTAAMTGFWSPVLAVLAVVEPPVPNIVWFIGIGSACILLATDIRSQLALPPISNASLQLPSRFQKGGTP